MEPNDTPQQATPLGGLSNELATGQLASSSDADVFSIDLSALTGLVTTVSGTLDGRCDPSNPAPDLQILRTDQTPVAYRTAAPDGCTVIDPAYELETGLLDAGRYYVRVVPPFTQGLGGQPAAGALRLAQLSALTEPAPQPYSVALTEADPLVEAEPNDLPAQATPLSDAFGFERSAVGNLDPIGGVDTYILDFAGPPTGLWAQTYMADEPAPCRSGPAMRIRLLDTAGDPVAAWPNNTGSCGYGTMALDQSPLGAGRYYLQVTQEPGGAYDATGERYRLDVAAVSPLGGLEVEPNDDPGSAMTLEPGRYPGWTAAITQGQLADGDVDFFALDVPTATPLIAGPYASAVPSLQLEILDSNGLPIPATGSGSQGGVTDVVPAGRYVVKVSGATGDYSIVFGYRTYSDVVDTATTSYFELTARGGFFFYPAQMPEALLLVKTPSRVSIACVEQPDPEAVGATATITSNDEGTHASNISCGDAFPTSDLLQPGEYFLRPSLQGPSLRRLGFTITEDIPAAE